MSIGSRGYRRQYESPDRRRLFIAGSALVAAVAAGLGGAFAFGVIGSQNIQQTATTDNMNCTLIVPANPLSAQGLATPYQLTATNPADGPCNEANTAQSAFVQNTDKANTYRSIVDQTALPAGQSPAEYCGDMESIQGTRLQQDVNLLINGPSPMPAAASNLFTFLAMRLQQSFGNLNCQNFGLQNDVSTTVDGNGVVVAACFRQQVNPVTAGAGNPTKGMTVCPATTASASASASATAVPTAAATGTAAPTAAASVTPTAAPTTSTGTVTTTRHRRHHHHRFF